MGNTVQQLEAMPWANVGARIEGVRNTLLYALDLTTDAFQRWELELADKHFSSEFDIPVAQARRLRTEDRLAHIARLLRSLALDYGLQIHVRTDTQDDASVAPVAPPVDIDSPAWILHQLDCASLADAASTTRGALAEERDA
jgi:hypothetical protein